MQRLKNKVAVVTGASRGAGRGIALVLGEEGGTVYVTGRSVRGDQTTGFPGANVHDIAEQVTARGGVGIPIRCDHTVDVQVEALFERVKQEHGHLDILVNNAWGGYEGYDDENFDAPFWEQPLSRWHKMLTAGVHSSMVTSYFAVPLMILQRQGLIVNTSLSLGHDEPWDLDEFHQLSVFYDTSKIAINRMAFGMAHNLRPHNVAAIALSPGWMNTEQMNPTPEDLRIMESVEYIGRAVAALAADPNVIEKTGRLLYTRDLGREYGFADIDGRQPLLWRDGEWIT